MKSRTKLTGGALVVGAGLVGALSYLDYGGFLIILSVVIITGLYFESRRSKTQ